MATDTTQRFTIPDSQKVGVANLARLPQEKVEALERSLENAPTTLSQRRVLARVSKETGIGVNELSEILGVLASLYLTKEHWRLSLDAVAESVVASATAHEVGGISKGSPEASALRERLIMLLSIEKTVGIIAKAGELLYTYPIVYQSARILTDVRPVFSSEKEPTPIASVISHTLVVDTSEGDTEGRAKRIFIALDSEDLTDLKRVIERASQKEAALRRILPEQALAPVAADHN